MTSPAIRLARECDAKQEFDFESDTPLMAFCELLVAKAQAQALRDAAENVSIWIKELDPDERYYVREQLQRRAEELEKC